MTQIKKKTTNRKPVRSNDPRPGSIVVCWCDGGTTDGKFTEGLVYSIFSTAGKIPLASAMRVQGNQIGRQRQDGFDYWLDKTDYEWILWVDSDIVINADVLQTLWASVDAKDRPVVSGTYFISKENERSLMTPFPALFNFVDDKPNLLAYLHPLPANALVKVDCAGFGFLLMHRSVGERMRVKHGKIPFFNETGVGDSFASEDINFFRLMHSAGVPLYAHTGAVVQHMKRFSFDLDFYKLFWNNNGKES